VGLCTSLLILTMITHALRLMLRAWKGCVWGGRGEGGRSRSQAVRGRARLLCVHEGGGQAQHVGSWDGLAARPRRTWSPP
jgi:hypothetical protein